jgi:hypothetical protein
MVRELILIDDSPKQASEIAGFLRTWGLNYAVISNQHILKPSENSDTARESFCRGILEFMQAKVSNQTEAILLDVLFQQGTEQEEPMGYRLGKMIRLAFPKVPIILFTVRSDFQDVADATSSFNFDGYISKSDFTSWRNSTSFLAALAKARFRRDEMLEEFNALRQKEFDAISAPEQRIDPVIMHLSDIHYGISLHESDGREAFGSTLDALQRDVTENYGKEGIPTPNLIVVSGDITSKGSLQGYPFAKEFLRSLAS